MAAVSGHDVVDGRHGSSPRGVPPGPRGPPARAFRVTNYSRFMATQPAPRVVRRRLRQAGAGGTARTGPSSTSICARPTSNCARMPGPPRPDPALPGRHDDQRGRTRWWDGRRWTADVRYSGQEQDFAGIVIDGRWIHFGDLSQPVAEVEASARLRRCPPAASGLHARGRRAGGLFGPTGPITPTHHQPRDQPHGAARGDRGRAGVGRALTPPRTRPRPGASSPGSTRARSTTGTADRRRSPGQHAAAARGCRPTARSTRGGRTARRAPFR